MSTTHNRDRDRELPELVDRDRWSGEVVASTTRTVTWGTHEWTVRLQTFEDGQGNITARGPSERPPCARAIVSDLLDGGGLEPWFAAVLADEWDIDSGELEAER